MTTKKAKYNRSYIHIPTEMFWEIGNYLFPNSLAFRCLDSICTLSKKACRMIITKHLQNHQKYLRETIGIVSFEEYDIKFEEFRTYKEDYETKKEELYTFWKSLQWYKDEPPLHLWEYHEKTCKKTIAMRVYILISKKGNPTYSS